MTVTNTSAYFAGASERNEEKIFFDQYKLVFVPGDTFNV